MRIYCLYYYAINPPHLFLVFLPPHLGGWLVLIDDSFRHYQRAGREAGFFVHSKMAHVTYRRRTMHVDPLLFDLESELRQVLLSSTRVWRYSFRSHPRSRYTDFSVPASLIDCLPCGCRRGPALLIRPLWGFIEDEKKYVEMKVLAPLRYYCAGRRSGDCLHLGCGRVVAHFEIDWSLVGDPS